MRIEFANPPLICASVGWRPADNDLMELWHVPLRTTPIQLDQAASLLDEADMARANRFRRAGDRAQYIAAHAALRCILAHAVSPHEPPAPERLRFGTTTTGKPFLVDAPAVVHFNLSHADGHALIAVSRQQEVGIDVECVEAAPLLDADDAVFSPYEIAAVRGLPPHLQPLACLRCWVRKEALLKAAAFGLDDDVRRISVSVDAQARLVESQHPHVDAGSWSVSALEPPGPWIGAVAVRGVMPAWTWRQWDWGA